MDQLLAFSSRLHASTLCQTLLAHRAHTLVLCYPRQHMDKIAHHMKQKNRACKQKFVNMCHWVLLDKVRSEVCATPLWAPAAHHASNSAGDKLQTNCGLIWHVTVHKHLNPTANTHTEQQYETEEPTPTGWKKRNRTDMSLSETTFALCWQEWFGRSYLNKIVADELSTLSAGQFPFIIGKSTVTFHKVINSTDLVPEDFRVRPTSFFQQASYGLPSNVQMVLILFVITFSVALCGWRLHIKCHSIVSRKIWQVIVSLFQVRRDLISQITTARGSKKVSLSISFHLHSLPALVIGVCSTRFCQHVKRLFERSAAMPTPRSCRVRHKHFRKNSQQHPFYEVHHRRLTVSAVLQSALASRIHMIPSQSLNVTRCMSLAHPRQHSGLGRVSANSLRWANKSLLTQHLAQPHCCLRRSKRQWRPSTSFDPHRKRNCIESVRVHSSGFPTDQSKRM